MVCQYHSENEIKAITSKAILAIKCRNKFYALFWNQDLLKSKDDSFEENDIRPEHVAEVLVFNEKLARDMMTVKQDNNLSHFNNDILMDFSATNQELAIKNKESLSYPIANSNQQLVQIKNSKRKIQYWVWIVLVILLLILLAGGGAIGYEFYRISTRSSIINSNIIGDDDISIGVDDEEQNIKDNNDDQIEDNKDTKEGQDQDIKRY